jgi:hypothetical protein
MKLQLAVQHAEPNAKTGRIHRERSKEGHDAAMEVRRNKDAKRHDDICADYSKLQGVREPQHKIVDRLSKNTTLASHRFGATR